MNMYELLELLWEEAGLERTPGFRVPEAEHDGEPTRLILF